MTSRPLTNRRIVCRPGPTKAQRVRQKEAVDPMLPETCLRVAVPVVPFPFMPRQVALERANSASLPTGEAHPDRVRRQSERGRAPYDSCLVATDDEAAPSGAQIPEALAGR